MFHGVAFDYEQPETTNGELIRTVVRRCLELAKVQGMRSIAFPALINALAPEQVAIALMTEIIKFSSDNTSLTKLTITIYGRKYQNRYVVDDTVIRFYNQVSNFLDLHSFMAIR